tara:strand:- start:43 stop:297 length:255 start_codon:yes stop_codon:yes gene_type:complete
MLKYSEACLIAGAWLAVSGLTGVGFTLICFSAILAFCRYALEFQKVKEQQQEKKEIMDAIENVLSIFISKLNASVGVKDDRTVH